MDFNRVYISVASMNPRLIYWSHWPGVGAFWWGIFNEVLMGWSDLPHWDQLWLSNIWYNSNISSPSQQTEQIPISFGVWPFCLTHFCLSILDQWILAGLWLNSTTSIKIAPLLLVDALLQLVFLLKFWGFVSYSIVNWFRVTFSNVLSTWFGKSYFWVKNDVKPN